MIYEVFLLPVSAIERLPLWRHIQIIVGSVLAGGVDKIAIRRKMPSGKEKIFLLVEIFGRQNFRPDRPGDGLILLRLPERGVYVQSRIVTSLAKRRSGIGFVVRIYRPSDDVVSGEVICRSGFIVAHIVQRTEICANLPSNADQRPSTVGTSSIFFQDFLVLISASQLRISELEFVDDKSGIGRTIRCVHLLPRNLKNITTRWFIVTVTQTANCYSFVDA